MKRKKNKANKENASLQANWYLGIKLGGSMKKTQLGIWLTLNTLNLIMKLAEKKGRKKQGMPNEKKHSKRQRERVGKRGIETVRR